jgi:glycosyltransferase involved in cell wall biosynthesis
MKKVSVVIPCYNEVNTLPLLLNALQKQSYPKKQIEILIADGFSDDGTRAKIQQFQKKFPNPKISILDNESRSIPRGLNLAIAKAKGDIILRLDAHCVPIPEYIQHSVADLEQKKGWNVGGVWDIFPRDDSWIAEAIALAASHPLGIGDARYRFAEKAQVVDTVPFGAFERSLIEKIGNFDERLKANEDYEFNARIRKAGGKVWLNPEIRSKYFSRPNIPQVAEQYARYGYWKWRMLRRYPETIKLRQALPPLLFLIIFILPFLSILWPWLLSVWIITVVSYALLLLSFGIMKALEMSKLSLVIGLPMAISTMHLSYGSALIWSVFHSGLRQS